MFSPEDFREVYALLGVDQTLDDAGAAVDCGVKCDKHCCRPGQTTKYLLPGERRYLSAALEERGDAPFAFASLGYFDTIVEPPTRACACEPLRDLRPFNCRVFPYSPRVEGHTVVGVKKGKFKYLEPCWIETPAPQWANNAVVVWQRVLDDVDNRGLFARLGTLWEWHKAIERGEDPGHVLTVIAALDSADDDEVWSRAARFFSRTE